MSVVVVFSVNSVIQVFVGLAKPNNIFLLNASIVFCTHPIELNQAKVVKSPDVLRCYFVLTRTYLSRRRTRWVDAEIDNQPNLIAVTGSHDSYRPKGIYLVYLIYNPKFICDDYVVDNLRHLLMTDAPSINH